MRQRADVVRVRDLGEAVADVDLAEDHLRLIGDAGGDLGADLHARAARLAPEVDDRHVPGDERRVDVDQLAGRVELELLRGRRSLHLGGAACCEEQERSEPH